MLSAKRALELVRELPDVTEYDHFGGNAFKGKGSTFVTVWEAKNTANLKLSPEEQRRFVMLDGEGFVEIDNAWGRQGWTTANLEFVDETAFREALAIAWRRSNEKARAKPTSRKKKSAPRRRRVTKRRP
jgi:YjbR